MREPLAEQIMQMVGKTSELYHRLLLVVAPSGAGKTKALLDVQNRTFAPLVNVNLELSRRMLDLTERQRALQLPRIFQEIVGNKNNDTVLLDNIEVIFDVTLKQDPLRLLQGLSRNMTLVVSWNGSIVDNFLTYGEPFHPEYRRYSLGDFLVASLKATK